MVGRHAALRLEGEGLQKINVIQLRKKLADENRSLNLSLEGQPRLKRHCRSRGKMIM